MSAQIIRYPGNDEPALRRSVPATVVVLPVVSIEGAVDRSWRRLSPRRRRPIEIIDESESP